MACLYREAQPNGIWEGSGNIICLDVLRSAHRYLQTIEVFLDEIATVSNPNTDFDRGCDALGGPLRNSAAAEHMARHLVERLGLLFQAIQAK